MSILHYVPRAVLALAGVGQLSACYSASLDPNATGVYGCDEPSDCADGHMCLSGVCTDDQGPELRIGGPEPLSKFSAAEPVSLSLFVQGNRLNLGEPATAGRDGEGYLEVRVDGERRGNLMTTGDLGLGVSQKLDLGVMTPGGHRVEVLAFHIDGTAFDNPSARATTVFWVDDGLPHVVIARPWPGDRFPLEAKIEMEVVGLNFHFVDPSFAAGDSVDGEGHTHVYAATTYPECLPNCLYSYAPNGSIKPVGEDPTTVVVGSLDPLMLEAGTIPLTASLNYSGHLPIPFKSEEDWHRPELFDELVYDTVVVELVESR
ncbi:MAG: hypothetical protein B7733_21735 [Myxococcales bacterium FL481]|nr:MAG: hypothetical protein B7733_21735 [Myxococcales bacterium FL481]